MLYSCLEDHELWSYLTVLLFRDCVAPVENALRNGLSDSWASMDLEPFGGVVNLRAIWGYVRKCGTKDRKSRKPWLVMFNY